MGQQWDRKREKPLTMGQVWDTIGTGLRQTGQIVMTDPIQAQQRLTQLQGKTLRAQLEPFWGEIENKISQGVSHAEIVQALVEAGIEVELGTFRKYLTRHRKKVGKKEVIKQPTGIQSAIPAPSENGNSPEPADDEETQANDLGSILDPRNREGLTSKYVNMKKPIGSKPK